MKISWTKTHWLVKKAFPNYIWDIPNKEKKVYLTFDDGPIPEITEWTLGLLEKYQAKATFFCIGDNIRKYPEIFKKTVSAGHAIGNHTFHHLNGWETPNELYLENVESCADEISIQFAVTSAQEPELQTEYSKLSTLFRPPYGKITPQQSKTLRKSGHKIIMWDVLSEDYNAAITKEKCLENVLKNVQSGSIIVFHDSIKAYPHLEYVLPRTLAFLKEKGFVCDRLD